MGLMIRTRGDTAVLARTTLFVWLLAAGGCSTSDWRPVARADSAGAYSASTSGDPYDRGKLHLQQDQLGLALQAFRTAMRQDPDSTAALNGMAVTYDELGRFDISRRYFEQALDLDPRSAETLNNLGRSLLRQGQVAAARAVWEDAARVAGDNRVIMANLHVAGRRLARVGKSAPAEATTAGRPDRLPPWVERTSFRVQTLVSALPPGSGPDVEPTVHRAAHVAGLGAAERESSIRALQARAETPAPAAAHALRLEVSNGAGRRHMAARMQRYLARHGLEVDRLSNADSFAYRDSTIFFRPGFLARAKQVAELLPHPVRLEPEPDQRSDVNLRLGGDLLDFDLTLLAS